MKPFALPRMFGLAGLLLALLAINTGGGVAHAAYAQAATGATPAGSRLSVSSGTESQVVQPGQSYILYYKIFNAGADKAVVQFSAASDAGWSVFLGSKGAVIAPNSTVELKIQVDVPTGTAAPSSLIKVGAFAADSAAVTYTKLVVGPSPRTP